MDPQGDRGLTISQPPSRPPSRATVTTFDTVNGSSTSSLDFPICTSSHISHHGSFHNLNHRSTFDHGGKAPGLKWHNEYDEVGAVRPRVLMIEYHRRDLAQQVRRVTAREFKELEELRSVYHSERNDNTVLRVFHVQNCNWGENYLLRKHAFHSRAPGVHTSSGNRSTVPNDFGRWVKERLPPRRLGKLMMSSRSWKTHNDPWRGVAKTAFGMDYMKAYTCEEDLERRRRSSEDEEWEEEGHGDKDRVLGLQGFDDHDNTIHAHNIYSQRLSVYVQYKHRSLPLPDPDIPCPYGSSPSDAVKKFDNGNTIIIIDNSHSKSIYDTIIPARGHLEAKWRRLPFTISFPPEPEADTEAHLNLHCMKMIVRDIFKAVVNTWERVLEVSWEHVSILEDAIYEQPADESRAPELWTNSAHWNRYEKLMFYHVDTMNEMRRYLGEFVDTDVLGDSGSGMGVTPGAVIGNPGLGIINPGEKGVWLEELPADFDKLSNLIQEDLVKPTANLSELMYRSVGIRDSRASLQLGSSMWRLSWITFIFLPGTFIVGFFGMNVETFAGEGTPNIKWFFISFFPFFGIVILGWYLLKHVLARSRRAPIQRGLYEALYTRLEEQNPNLWTRQGPRDYIMPADWASRTKWKIIKYWTEESRLPKPGEINEPIGAWNRIKRYLIQKWTAEIKIKTGPSGKMPEDGLELGEVLTVENPNAGRLVPEGRVMFVKTEHGGHTAEERAQNRDESGPGAVVTISVDADEDDEAMERGREKSKGPAADENSEILVEERLEGSGEERPQITQSGDAKCEHRVG